MEKRKIEKKKVNKIKTQFFIKINKIHKQLPGLTKEKHTPTQLRKERRGDITTKSTEIKRINKKDYTCIVPQTTVHQPTNWITQKHRIHQERIMKKREKL